MSNVRASLRFDSRVLNGGADAAELQQTTPVAVIGAVRLYREALAESLRARGEWWANTGEYHVHNVAEAIARAPAVVVLDTSTRHNESIIRALRRALPSAKLIACGVDEQDSDLVTLAESGVAGYLTSDSSLDDLVRAIESALRGEVVCPPHVAATLLKRLASQRESGSRPSPEAILTGRERQVADLLYRGLSNKEIAATFNISEATVKNHVHSVLHKLRVTRRSQVAAHTPPVERAGTR